MILNTIYYCTYENVLMLENCPRPDASGQSMARHAKQSLIGVIPDKSMHNIWISSSAQNFHPQSGYFSSFFSADIYFSSHLNPKVNNVLTYIRNVHVHCEKAIIQYFWTRDHFHFIPFHPIQLKTRFFYLTGKGRPFIFTLYIKFNSDSDFIIIGDFHCWELGLAGSTTEPNWAFAALHCVCLCLPMCVEVSDCDILLW